jgi:hypothetical protein
MTTESVLVVAWVKSAIELASDKLLLLARFAFSAFKKKLFLYNMFYYSNRFDLFSLFRLLPRIDITFPKLTNDRFMFEPSFSCFLL